MKANRIFAEDVEVCPKCGSTEFWENRIICVGDDPTAERSGTQSSIAENSGTKWIANAERALGLHYLLENGVTPNAYYKLLLELGASRKAASEHRKEMLAMQLVADGVNLYDELKVKLNDAFT